MGDVPPSTDRVTASVELAAPERLESAPNEDRKRCWWLVFLYAPAAAVVGALGGVALAYGSSSHGWFGVGLDALIYAMVGAGLGFCGGLLVSAVELLGRWANRRRPDGS
jgi:hypothetical protein